MGEIADFLINKYQWYEGIARAIERAHGRCEYCKEDLLETRLGYSSIVMDHILPKSIYPNEEWNFANHALSCSSCNAMKGNYDPLESKNGAAGVLQNNRQELIRLVQEHLAKKILNRRQEWIAIRDKVRS